MNSQWKADPKVLIESHLTYAHALAAEVLRKLPQQIEKGDLEGAADLGLVEAASTFDPSRGVLFKTYAYYRIRGAIFDSLRKMGWFSKGQYQQYRFEMAANEYLKDYSAFPPQEGTAEDAYQELRSVPGSLLSCYLLSLDEMPQEIEERTSSSPEARLQHIEDLSNVREALSRLPEKNRLVLEDYYIQELSLEEIGKKIGLSKSWVSRIHAKGLEMMREALVDSNLKKQRGTKKHLVKSVDNR